MKNHTHLQATTEKTPIVYVLDNFIRGGGTENQLAALIDNMDRTRFTPYVFNLRPKWQDIEIDCDVTYLNVTSLISFKAIKAVFTIARFLRKIKAKIIQVYFFDSRVIGTLAGRLAGVKNIIFCRREMGWAQTPTKIRVFRQMAKLSHYCLVNAHVIKDMVGQVECFPPEKIEVIYNGIVVRNSHNNPQLDKTYFGIPDSSPVIGMIANFRPIKRIDRLIRITAMLQNRDVHLLIIGEGPLENDLKKLAKESGISERVHMIHTVSGVLELLKIHDVGVLTSQSEGLSNVLIEYAWSGVPAVAFDIGGNREVILDGKTGFLTPPYDETAMAEKIDYLLGNRTTAEQMGKAAKEIAAEKFDVTNMTKKTEEFYWRILNEMP